MTFKDNLRTGRVAESLIAQWMIRKGYAVLPVYEIAEQQYKGPHLFSVKGSFVAPDMLAIKPGNPSLFVEAKCKTGFTWSRQFQRFETGIDIKHYEDYLKVRSTTGFPLWILFLQHGGAVKDAPPDKPDSPRGLFGNEILILQAKESHRSDKWGKSGMVYWSTEYPVESPALRLIEKYEEVIGLPI